MRREPSLGGWVPDADWEPVYLDLWSWSAWQERAERQHQVTGWHPSWVAKSRVGALEISTVFLPTLLTLPAKPFETWVRGGRQSDFYRYRTWWDAWVGHGCAVWRARRRA